MPVVPESDRPSGDEQSHGDGPRSEVLAKAVAVFGSAEAGERWLNRPAIGLDRRRPIDLLDTPEGCDAVRTYLDRIDHGVYA